MKTILPVLFALLLLLLLASAGLVAAQPAAAATFAGNITIGTSPVAAGTVIDVFNGSNSATSGSITIGGQQWIDTARFNYSAVTNCDNSTAVFIKVWGINGTAQGCIFSTEISANISVSLVANGASCKYGNACSGGYCCSGATSINSSTGSGTCQASACAAAAAAADTGGGGSSSGGGGGGGGGGAGAAAPAAPSQETVDVVKGALPATFQVAADAGNVEYKTVSAPEVKEVPVAVEAVAKTLEQLATVVNTEEAKQAFAEIQQAISSGGSMTLSVKKTIEVIKATNKVTGEAVTVSVVKLSISAPADKALKNVEIVEVIPKAAASNVNQVTFNGEKPVVLQADPVVKWAFAEVLKGQTKSLSYVINRDISNLGTNTIAVSKKSAEEAVQPSPAPEAPAPAPAAKEPGKEVRKPTPVSTIVLVVVLAVVVVGGWLFLKGRKKAMK